jgi:hypothetical protein
LIIAMVRNPVEMVYSWHSELRYQTIEDIADFEQALDAENDRVAGRRIPTNARNSYVESLFYRQVASFTTQIERYVDAFGADRVHVVVNDDLRADPSATYRGVLAFLGADPTFEPQFAARNANKVVRSRALQRLYFATSAPGHGVVRALIPAGLRRRMLAANVSEAPRGALPDALRHRLASEFRPEVERLSDLLGRDLSPWLHGATVS